jgi:hypothetical protein
MVFFDFFGDVLGAESDVARLARAMARQWGEGAMRPEEDEARADPSLWRRFLFTRAGLLNDCRLYAEAVREQGFPLTAEHSIDEWEYERRVPPPRSGMLTGDRLERIMAYCRIMMGARVTDVVDALLSVVGIDDAFVLEHTALDVAEDPEQIFVFWTLVKEAVWEDEYLRTDTIDIVDRWKPAHAQHGRNEGNPRAGVRVGSAADVSTPAYFKTGVGSEKTSRNLIPLT